MPWYILVLVILGLLLAQVAHCAQSVIGVGSLANDGTGDNLRTTQQKANLNFTELYNGVGWRTNGLFTNLTSDGVYLRNSTPLATTLAVTSAGKIVPQANSVFNVMLYGAIANGSSDDTTAVQAAYDAIDKSKGGTVYFPVGNYKFNLIVQHKNITLLFDSWVQENAGTPTITGNQVGPYDLTKPCVTIGNGTTSAKGCRIIGGLFKGTGLSNAGVLLRLAGGAYACKIDGANFIDGKTNIWIQGTGSQQCIRNKFSDGTSQSANVANSRAIYVAAPTSGTSATTRTRFDMFSVDSQASDTNTGCLEVDGTIVYFSNSDFGFIDGSPMFASNSAGISAVNPVIVCSNVAFDGGSTVAILVDKYGGTKRISAFVQGDYSWNGSARMLDGAVLDEGKCQSAGSVGGNVSNPFVRGAAYFESVEGGTTNRYWQFIGTEDANKFNLQVYNTNGTLSEYASTNISLGSGSVPQQLIIQPSYVAVTNQSMFRVYGAAAGNYSESAASLLASTRIATAAPSSGSIATALHLDHYLNGTAGDFSRGEAIDWGLSNSTNGSFMSRIVGFNRVDVDTASKLQFVTHSSTTGVENVGMTLDHRGALSIGDTNAPTTGILNLVSTSKAFYPPRMTKAQRDAISPTPSDGATIIQTDGTGPGLRTYVVAGALGWVRLTQTADP